MIIENPDAQQRPVLLPKLHIWVIETLKGIYSTLGEIVGHYFPVFNIK